MPRSGIPGRQLAESVLTLELHHDVGECLSRPTDVIKLGTEPFWKLCESASEDRMTRKCYISGLWRDVYSNCLNSGRDSDFRDAISDHGQAFQCSIRGHRSRKVLEGCLSDRRSLHCSRRCSLRVAGKPRRARKAQSMSSHSRARSRSAWQQSGSYGRTRRRTTGNVPSPFSRVNQTNSCNRFMTA
jgi:hypothetical protein